MERQRRVDAQPEFALRRELRRRGLRCRLQRRLGPDTRRTTDDVFPGPRIVVWAHEEVADAPDLAEAAIKRSGA